MQKHKPPEIDESPEAKAAWDALVEEEGYPMGCAGVVARGYFSAGWRSAAQRLNARQKVEKKIPLVPPSKVPE